MVPPPPPLILIFGKEKEPGQKKEGKVHNDMWVLNMKPAVSGGSPTWDRVRERTARRVRGVDDDDWGVLPLYVRRTPPAPPIILFIVSARI